MSELANVEIIKGDNIDTAGYNIFYYVILILLYQPILLLWVLVLHPIKFKSKTLSFTTFQKSAYLRLLHAVANTSHFFLSTAKLIHNVFMTFTFVRHILIINIQ